MSKNRLEAFSDGVIAIIITIMVLELAVPHEAELTALQPLIPVFLSYVLSFVYVGIYWNNHHHLLQASRRVSGSVLWANLHLLFWLSLIPFASAWMGENDLATGPLVLYGIVLWMAGLAYYILAQALIRIHGHDSMLATAIGSDRKGLLSLVVYTVAIITAFFNSWLAFVIYAVVAIMWLIPDRRIENRLGIGDQAEK